MPEHFQQNLPALPLERLETRGEGVLQKVDAAPMSFAEARRVTGSAAYDAIRKSGRGLKDFGDPAQVGRQCKGLENVNIARLWQDQQTREEFVVELAERAGLTVQVVIVAPRRKR